MLSKTIQDAKMMLEAFRLKFTYRYTDRPIYKWEKESVGAHTWWMMITADYILQRLEDIAPWKYRFDREKIYSLITYHDLIEAETGDVDLDPNRWLTHDEKLSQEATAMKIFPSKIPVEIRQRFLDMHSEYEARETLESRFVKIIDIFDAEFQIHERKELFENWSYEYRESIRRPHFKYFPELKELLDDVLKYGKDNNYFLD